MTLTRDNVTQRPATVVVTVVGSVAGLAEQLPPDWLVQPDDPDEIAPTDLLVLVKATGAGVAAARRRYPGIPIVGVVDALAPVDDVVAVLEAGADACVRSGQPALVGSHLRACHRRQRYAA